MRGSGGVRAGANRLGCDGIEIGAVRLSSLLEVVQRLGIHGDVAAHLGLGCGAVGAQRLGLSRARLTRLK